MGENKGLWERKSSGETESSGSASSLSEKQLDEEVSSILLSLQLTEKKTLAHLLFSNMIFNMHKS